MWPPNKILFPIDFSERSISAARYVRTLGCRWTGVHLEQAPPLEALRIQDIVCAVDLKLHRGRLLEWAQQISGELQAALHVAHAIPAYETTPACYFDAELRLHLEAEGKEAIQKFLNAREVEAAIDVHGGEVAHVFRCAAQRLSADLVVIGRSSDSGLVGRLRADAYSIIRQSPCPVVSV
jgi:nucleotide-binding universal stress UspA family protein